jgi:uncharacterized protein (TIGR02217 family)
MPQIPSFHEVLFPLRLAFGSTGGPVRKTEIVTLGSGREQRNARWSQSRRRFEVGQAARTVDDLYEILAFFEERKGRLFGFRFRDPFDWKSGPPGQTPLPADQPVGTGDGVTAVFQLQKSYGPLDFAPRRIAKPVEGSVRVAVDGNELASAEFETDYATGQVTLDAAPASGAIISAGYEFDIPVRFDADEFSVNLAAFKAGEIPSLPLIEILP